MSTYTDLSCIERDFISSNGITLSYIDLMSDLRDMIDGKYYFTYLNISPSGEEESGDIAPIITDDQKIINEEIEKITSFNVTAYAVIKRRNEDAHKTILYPVDDHNFEHVAVNGYYMKEPVNNSADSEYYIDPETTLTYLESIYFTNTNSIEISIDNRFEQYDEKGNKLVDEEGHPIYGEIKKGDYFYLYLVVGTITTPAGLKDPAYTSKLSGANAEIFYKFTYNPAEENDSATSDDNEDAQNEWVIVPDEEEEDDSEPSIFTPYYLSDERWSDYIFINTVSWTELGQLPNRTLHAQDHIARIYISPLCPVSFTCILNVTRNNRVKQYTVNYVPKSLNVTKPHVKRAVKMNNPDVSYALLRTNPKLTGNIKVVIDENSNIYVDTFKVSNVLSRRKYRHIKVGSNSYYGSTLVKYFKDMPTTEFYKVENKCFNLFSTVQSYQEQFYDIYRCGVKTNDDNLYSENYALLAPLCIKRILPDFFLIFRVDKNSILYDEETMSNEDKIKYFLSQGKLIKSFDMRKDSPLGTYIRTIYDRSKEEPGDMYVSYSTDNLNKFIGISLEKGTVASMYESAYNEANIRSQVALNDFYTEGFERNHIVSKNIINFEYMFNDNDVEAFSLNTYFGIYVKVNEQEESFSCLDDGTTTGYTFDTSVYSFNPGFTLSNSKINSVIYGLTTPYEFIRLDSGILNNPALIPYKSKPYKNLLTTRVYKIDLKEAKSFMTVNINKPFEVGDHYRIIDTLNDIIYEVIVCDIDAVKILEKNTFDDIDVNKSETHNLSDVTVNYYNEYGVDFEIRRIGLYTHYRAENELKENSYNGLDEDTEIPPFAKTDTDIIAEQTEQLYYAFQKLGDDNISSYKYDNNSVSFISRVDGTMFERICAASGFDETTKQYVYETEDENDSLTFFGYIKGHKIILDLTTLDAVSHEIPIWRTKSYAYLYPIHFEITGNRMAYVCGFIDINQIGDGVNVYECKIDNDKLDLFDTKTILYHDTNKLDEYDTEIHRSIYEPMEVSVIVNDNKVNSLLLTKKKVKYIQSFNNLSKYIINVKDPLLKNEHISLFSSYPLNSGVCSIFNIKDFDFNVLDSKSVVNSSKSNDPVGTPGEYRKNSIFSGVEYEQHMEEIKEEPTIDELKGVVSNITESLNEFGDPFCHGDFDTFEEYDQILTYDDEKYVIKHYNIEDYVNALKNRLLYFNKNTSTMIDRVDGNKNYISKENYEKLKTTLGLEETEDYAGIVLRPFVTNSNVAYNETYAYFNYLVSYKSDILSDIGSYLCLYSNEPDENERYEWGGINTLISNITVNDFVVSELISSDFDNPSIVYEDESDMKLTQKRGSIADKNTVEESFLDYVDKFENYSVGGVLMSGSNQNIFRTSYLKDMYKTNHTKFDISLVCPYTCKWKSIGTDARIKDLRLMYDYAAIQPFCQSYYLVNDNEFSAYLGVLYLQNKNSIINEEFGKKYINRSLDDVLFIDKKHLGKYEKNFILEGEGALDDILYDTVNSENKFSVAYTLGDNILEFISGGIKFRIKSNSVDILNFKQYSGYSVVFVSLPIKNITSDKPVELIIDELRHEIMLVWYCYTNTLEFGVKMRLSMSNDLENNIDVFRGLNACKINYTKKVSDISYKPIITEHGSYKGSLVEDTMGFYKIKDKNTKDSEYVENAGDKNFTRVGKKLCATQGYIYISNMGKDPLLYTSNNIAVVTGKIYNELPIIKNIDYTYPYYNEEGYITPVNPFIWHTNKDAQYTYHEELTDTGIDLYTNNLGNIKDSILYTDDISCVPTSQRTIQDLKEVINDCGIYIKKINGLYDYTTVEDLLSVEVVDPIKFDRKETYKRHIIDPEKIIKDGDKKGHIIMHTDSGAHYLNFIDDTTIAYNSWGYVHSTYAEPVMKDMLSFYYNSGKQNESYDVDDSTETYISNTDNNDLESVFNLSFDGANVYIKDTNNIEQIWINKYTTNNNYCLVGKNNDIKSMVFPIDVIKNVSIMSNCSVNTEFRKYSLIDESYLAPEGEPVEDYIREEYSPVKGYTGGVEIKTFLNSQALSLNLDKIEIEKWKNTEVSVSEKCIKLNITNSLIDYILEQSSFYNMWKNIKLKDNLYKIQYTKNCILKYININNKIKFELRRSKNKTKTLKCSNKYYKNFIEYTNFKNELKYEDDKYYMYVYVDEFYTYYPKITIML